MIKVMTIYYAVSRTGQGRVFTTLPERNEAFGIWCGESVGFVSSLFMYMESDGFRMPDLKWHDDPAKLTISLEF